MDYGTGKNQKFLPIHELSSALGPIKSSGLPMFHALTGCDTTSFFYGIGKTRAWTAWNQCPEINGLFQELSNPGYILDESKTDAIGKFVVTLYDKELKAESINEARKVIYSRGTRSLENVPPTQGALEQHVKRAAYQAGHVWGQALVCNPVLPSPAEHGWIKCDKTRKWNVNWTDLGEASISCRQLLKCSCKKKCTGRCTCMKNDLQCTSMCKCTC